MMSIKKFAEVTKRKAIYIHKPTIHNFIYFKLSCPPPLPHYVEQPTAKSIPVGFYLSTRSSSQFYLLYFSALPCLGMCSENQIQFDVFQSKTQFKTNLLPKMSYTSRANADGVVIAAFCCPVRRTDYWGLTGPVESPPSLGQSQ